jgi:O-antigen/teichoic acid export membrane protein
MVQNLINSVAQIVSFAILARLITPREMGILAALNIVNASCLVLGTVALQQAATRFVAERLQQDKHVAAAVFYQALRTTFILAALIGATVFLGSSDLSNLMFGVRDYAVYFQVLAFDIVIYTGLTPVLSSTLFGLQKFKAAAGVGILNTLVRQSLIVSLIVLLQSFLGLAVAWFISDLVIACVYAAYLLRYLGPPRFNFPLRVLVSYSWPLAVSNGVSTIYSFSDSAVLLAMVPLATLGVYNATLQAFSALSAISNAIGSTLFPAYSALQTENQSGGASDAMRLASRYVYLTSIPLTLGLFATSKPALTLFVGRAYVTGAPPLMVLTGVFAVTMIGIVLGPMLLALAHTRAASVAAIGSVIISLATALLLVPAWSMLGASVARALGMITSTALTILFLKQRLRLNLDLRTMFKTLIAGAAMAVIVIAVQVSIYSPYLLPFYVVVGAVSYLAALRLLKVVKQADLDLIEKYFGHRLRFAARLLKWSLLPNPKR